MIYIANGQHYPDGDPGTSTITPGLSTPVWVLYNKYTAVLRVLTRVNTATHNEDYESAIMTLNFNINQGTQQNPVIQSAAFSFFEQPSHALDAFPKQMQASSVNLLKEDMWFWLAGDFVLAYDPCVCSSTYTALYEGFKIDYQFIDNASVNLTGTLATAQDTVASVSNKKLKSAFGIIDLTLNSFSQLGKFKAGFDKVSKMLTTREGTKNDIKKVATSQQQSLSIFQRFLNIEQQVGNDRYSLTYMEKGVDGEVEKATTTTTGSSSPESSVSILGVAGAVADAIIPGYKIVKGFYDFFTAGGKSESSSNYQAMSFSANLDITGSITYNSSGRNTIFKLPQPVPNNTPYAGDHFQPLYNEELGVFNLVNTPKLYYVDYYQKITKAGCYDVYHPEVRQYKVAEPIQFVLNPASGLKMVNIEASFILNYDAYPPPPTLPGNYFIPPANHLQFGNNYTLHIAGLPKPYTGLIDPQKNIEETLEDAGYEIDQMDANWPSSGIVRINTNYVPLNLIQNHSFAVQLNNYYKMEPCYQYVHPLVPNPHITLKVSCLMQKEDDPTAEPVLFVATYAVDVEHHPTLHNTNLLNPENKMGDGYSLTSDYAGGGPVWDMPFLGPKTLTIDNNSNTPVDAYAREYIYIGPNATVASGSHIVAGRGIKVHPQAKVEPNVVLRIGLPFASWQVDPAAARLSTSSELAALCSDTNKYDPRVTTSLSPVFFDDLEEEEEKEPTFTIHGLLPNPATNHAALLVETNTDDIVLDVDILSVTGVVMRQVQKRPIYAGTSRVELPIDRLARGVYIVRATATNGESYTERLVVQ